MQEGRREHTNANVRGSDDVVASRVVVPLTAKRVARRGQRRRVEHLEKSQVGTHGVIVDPAAAENEVVGAVVPPTLHLQRRRRGVSAKGMLRGKIKNGTLPNVR